MAEVGTYYVTIMPEMSKFTSGINTALGKAGTAGGKQYTTSFIDVVKGSALGSALGTLATKVGGAIMSGLSTGIDRADTLRNFPRVMEAMGFSADNASEQIKKIMERLRGLPASTQDVVRLTQAIADSTGDLDLAADASLAFTDAMIAQGASAGEITQAQGVLNRVLGKGNATVAQWQSLLSVMTPQLNAVAKELLGESGSVEELRDKLNDGTIGWNEFLEAMVKLDNEGSGSMASFYEQAKANSDGIGTAIQNMGWRIGNGWAEIINAIGVDSISGTINGAADLISGAMTNIGNAIKWVKDAVGQTTIAESLEKIAKAAGEFVSSLWTESDTAAVKSMATALINLTEGALSWLADNGGTVKVVLGGITGAIAGLIGFGIGSKLAALPGIITAVWTAISANPIGIIITLISAAAMALYTFFTQTETGRKIISDVAKDMKAAFDRIKQNLEDNKVQWQKFCDNVVNFVTGLWNGIKGIWDSIVSDVTGTFDQIRQNLEDNKVQWELFKTNVATFCEETKTAVVEKWQAIKGAVTNFVTTIKNTISSIWQAIKKKVTDTNEQVRSTIQQKWQAIKTLVTTIINAVKNVVSTTWDSMRSAAASKWDAIKTGITSRVNALKTAVTNTVTTLKTTVSTTWDTIKSTASSKWDGIKTTISNKMSGAKTSVSNKLADMRTAITTFAPKFKEIAAPVIGSISGALDSIRSLVENFRPSFPQISWPTPSLPHIPVPHFSVSWKSIAGGVVKIPSVSFNGWYAKGGVFDAPTVIGVGEAGKEAALPLNRRTYGEIARGIAREGAGSVVISGNNFYVRDESDIDRIAERLAQKIQRERWSMA